MRGCCVLVLVFGCAGVDRSREEREILLVLTRQAEAWNQGDLETFLEGYWKSDHTVFAGGDKVHRGFRAMAERYRAAYPTRERMGRLTFSELVFEQIDSARAVLTGSWQLEITGSEKRPGGVFTLLWRRFDDGWKIVHDHTSSRP